MIGREIEFLAQNQTLIAQAKFMDAVALSGVAYDENTRTMFLSDLRNKNNMSIFSNNLTDKNFTLKPLHKSNYITISIYINIIITIIFFMHAYF